MDIILENEYDNMDKEKLVAGRSYPKSGDVPQYDLRLNIY